jgi:hypothetical protein
MAEKEKEQKEDIKEKPKIPILGLGGLGIANSGL